MSPIEESLRTETISPRRLRVVQIAATLRIGGSEQLAAAIGRGLDPVEFESLFAAVGPDGPIGDSLRHEGFSVTPFDRRDGLDARLLFRIWNYLRQQRPDIVQTHHVASLIYGGVSARLTGAKLIHTEHEINTFRQFPRQLQWLRLLAPLVHRFVAIDPTVAEFLQDTAKIDPSRIRIIRNGIRLERFHPRSEESPAVSGNPRDFVLGWIARLDPPKRPDVLIEALKDIAARDSTVRIRIIGPGSLLETVRNQVAQSKLEDRVEILGPRSDIPEQLRKMDGYVLVSDAEGLPISLAEAMASGLPCIASAVGGIPALIRDGQNGILLTHNNPDELATHVLRLRTDAALRARLGAEARQTIVSQYDFAQTICDYANLFREVVT